MVGKFKVTPCPALILKRFQLRALAGDGQPLFVVFNFPGQLRCHQSLSHTHILIFHFIFKRLRGRLTEYGCCFFVYFFFILLCTLSRKLSIICVRVCLLAVEVMTILLCTRALTYNTTAREHELTKLNQR